MLLFIINLIWFAGFRGFAKKGHLGSLGKSFYEEVEIGEVRTSNRRKQLGVAGC